MFHSKSARLKWLVALSVSGLLHAQDQDQKELGVEHAECALFGPQRQKFMARKSDTAALGELTVQVVKRLGVSRAGVAAALPPPDKLGLIDRHIFGTLSDAGVAPAEKTNDFEFIRRVTLDLTGRVPAPERVLQFASDASADKRARLIDELLGKPEWVDKWTMFFGDLYKNNDRNAQVTRYAEGRNAFYQWIHDSLAGNKSYDRMARELITAAGANSHEQGELNWTVGGFVTGGPRTGQDLFDQEAANAADVFLGVSHMNCLLCHNGRGHLDSLSLWGKTGTRYSAWQLAAFFSHTSLRQTRVGGAGTPYYWSVEDNTTYKVDYGLNTTTGNRPARQPIGSERMIAPVYPFSGRGPQPGESYRTALAREITGDIQFARATVNYIWSEFFGRGLVDPVDQFDLARLDPDNPPPDPWKLQASHPRLLNELAADFVKSRFDLKALMRQIANSESYQLSARYNGDWNAGWERLFARKLVRRLWAEEIHDAIAQTSGQIPNYNVRGIGTVRWAMQLPEPRNLPGGAVTVFLDSFLRGNREDEDRRLDGSPSQALGLMNDSFVLNRTRASGGAANTLLARAVNFTDDQLVSTLFLGVLSRYPTDQEMAAAIAHLRGGNRTQRAENLLWTLYNKVDFIYNY